MFARVSTYEFPAGRVVEARSAFGEALVEIAATQGLSEAFFMISRESGHGIALTLWEDQDSMTASRMKAGRLRGDAAASAGGGVVSVDEFEIAVHVQGTGVAGSEDTAGV